MKPKASYAKLCGLFDKTKQAFFKRKKTEESNYTHDLIIIEAVKRIRHKTKTHRWGVRKILPLVKLELTNADFTIGRDKLFDILRDEGMLVKPRKRKVFTTQSFHWLRKYQNLIENLVVSRPNQVWVSDITYLNYKGDTWFLYLITDVYSQKIVGWCLSKNLKAASAIKALEMAIKGNEINPYSLIHHSDRGVQYCSNDYVQLLNSNHIHISMTRPASPQENAIAERVNGILKEEWLYDMNIINNNNLREIISIYNAARPHNTLNGMTPNEIHDKGFLRNETERIIGKTYKYKKVELKHYSTQPLESKNAIGPKGYPLLGCSSAEPNSVLPWHCKNKLVEENYH